jgi:hypothetical protein
VVPFLGLGVQAADQREVSLELSQFRSSLDRPRIAG